MKLVEPACNFAPDRTNKLLVTLLNGSAVIAKFGQPVVDHPANPYSIDFQVFGNAFFAGGTLADDNSNLNTVALGTLLFTEPMKVSVSPGFTGQPGEDPGQPETWPWYRYENGPYCDTAFPTHAYKWHRAAAKWSDELMDFTKPVNPALSGAFVSGGMKVADGIDLYDGSGGGTGFDLKPSGFASTPPAARESGSPETGGLARREARGPTAL